MKEIFLALSTIMVWTLIFSQEKKDPIYIYFNSSSDQQCTLTEEYLNTQGNSKNLKMFEEAIQQNGDIFFYVCGALFEYSSNTPIDTLSISSKPNFEFADFNKLIKIVEKENPLYPGSVFENIYIVEKMKDKKMLKYKVQWKYFIQ